MQQISWSAWRSSIKKQAIVLTAAILIVGVASSALAMFLVWHTRDGYLGVDAARQQQVRIATLGQDMTDQSAALQAYALTADPKYLPLYLSARRDVEPLKLSLASSTTPRTKKSLGPLIIEIAVWQAWAEQLRMQVFLNGPINDTTFDQQGNDLIELVRFSESAAEVASQQDAQDQLVIAQHGQLALFVATAAAAPVWVGLVLLLGALVVRTAITPILELVAAAERLARGEPAQIPVPTRRDEVGRLATALDAWRRLEVKTEQIVADLRAVSTTVERTDILTLASERLLAELESDRIVMAMADGDHWSIVAASPEGPVGHTANLSMRAVEAIREHGFYAGDARAGHLGDPFMEAWCIEANLGPMLALSLVAGGELLGAAAIFRTVGCEEFSRIDLHRAETMLPQIAAALQVANLFGELRSANEAIQLANKHKSDFLAGMSHELRTPLNSILGFSQMLLEQPQMAADPVRRERYLSNIRSAGHHLLGLINDVLDLSKIEAGRMDLRLDRVDLPSLVEGVITTVGPLAAAKSIDLCSSCPDDLEIRADGTRIRQVLLNLLSNAIKFTPDGGSVRLLCERSKGGTAIAVQDTGIGIAKEEQARVFDEFQQLEAGRAKGNQGTGLGLSLTRRFVELHGGTLTLVSEVGHGSIFTIHLPDASAHHELDVIGDFAGNDGPTVLVADDDPVAARLLAEYLGQAGYRVAWARDGESVLRTARLERPAAITLDILLPDPTGWAILQRLSTNPETAHIPVIVVSVVEDRARALKLGAIDQLVKPVDRQTLLQVVKAGIAGASMQPALARWMD